MISISGKILVILLILPSFVKNIFVVQFNMVLLPGKTDSFGCTGIYTIQTDSAVNYYPIYVNYAQYRAVIMLPTGGWMITSITKLQAMLQTEGDYSAYAYHLGSGANIGSSVWTDFNLTITKSDLRLVLVGVQLRQTNATANSSGLYSIILADRPATPILFSPGLSLYIGFTSQQWTINPSSEITSIYNKWGVFASPGGTQKNINKNRPLLRSLWDNYLVVPQYVFAKVIG